MAKKSLKKNKIKTKLFADYFGGIDSWSKQITNLK